MKGLKHWGRLGQGALGKDRDSSVLWRQQEAGAIKWRESRQKVSCSNNNRQSAGKKNQSAGKTGIVITLSRKLSRHGVLLVACKLELDGSI